MAALTLIAVGFLALAGVAGSGARMLLQGRQRQAATEISSRQIEHMRNLPYSDVALDAPLVQDSDPAHPDSGVGLDGTSYDHDGNGDHESLVIAASGRVPHVEAFTVGTTALTAYQYITWVDDPQIAGTQDYKRITIVVWFDAPAGGGRPRTLSASTLLSPGVITAGTGPGGATVGSGGPTPTPTPTITPGSCLGTDILPPVGELTIASGTGATVGYTASTTVTILLSITDTCAPIKVRLSNDGVNFGADIIYDPVNPTVTWSLASGDGPKNVWARFTDAAGNLIIKGPESVVLDQTIPTSSGVLNRSLLCVGSNRTVTLTWGPSIDTNLVGYRVYRSVDNGPWEIIATTALLTSGDTHKKSLDSVRYRVVGYDKAGNEDVPSAEVTLSKNQCV